MASLREIKDRIGSVRSTLKITSAMKLVASAKLRKAQRTIEALRPYEKEMSRILSVLPAPVQSQGQGGGGATAVVAIASNSSLCGAFNANVLRRTQEVVASVSGSVEVHAMGRKLSEALSRSGCVPVSDHHELVASPDYAGTSELARSLVERYEKGELSSVVLVYTHFVSSSRLVVMSETYLPFSAPVAEDSGELPEDYIIEPDAEELARQMLPQLMMLKFYAAVLDSSACEHAARTIAMQTASDNAEDLLAELTLEYNKGRQQKITSEILDLVGGSQS